MKQIDISRLRPMTLHISLLLLAAAVLESCGSKKNGTPPPQVKDYPVLTIVPRSVRLFNDFPATIEGIQNVEIRPLIDGYLDRIYVDEGATVRRGQTLFHIRAPQYEQEVRTAQAAVLIARADVSTAEMNVAKVRPLVEKNIISRYELQSAQYQLQSRQGVLAQAQATLANAQTNLGYTTISSPVDGVIGALPLKIGSLVSRTTATPLTTVSNIGNIFAYFSINEKQALAFSARAGGVTTRDRLASIPPVTLVLANGEELPAKGHVESAQGLINTQTGAVRVRATFPNPGALVRSGSSGTIRIPATIDTALVIPQQATYEIQGKTFVYRVDTANKVASVGIRIRPGTGGQFYVVEAGLRPGDRIVTEGVAGLREGVSIRPRPVSADAVSGNVVPDAGQ